MGVKIAIHPEMIAKRPFFTFIGKHDPTSAPVLRYVKKQSEIYYLTSNTIK
jgi:hypothetical protein